MNGENADITFTSPPHNMKASNIKVVVKEQYKKKYINNVDDVSCSEYLKFLKTFTSIGLQFSKFVFVNIASLSGNKIALIDFLFQMKEKYADTIIWNKVHPSVAMNENILNSKFEYIHVFSNTGKRNIGMIPFRGTIHNLIDINRGHNEFADIHKAVFPVELPAFFIKNFARDSLLELFGGTGTTLIAAEQLKKTCFCMEKEPLYVDVIIRRWQKLTGQQAILESNRKSFEEISSERSKHD